MGYGTAYFILQGTVPLLKRSFNLDRIADFKNLTVN